MYGAVSVEDVLLAVNGAGRGETNTFKMQNMIYQLCSSGVYIFINISDKLSINHSLVHHNA